MEFNYKIIITGKIYIPKFYIDRFARWRPPFGAGEGGGGSGRKVVRKMA